MTEDVIDDGFEVPSSLEASWTEELVGHRITIFWDGDNAFYPCLVVRYHPMKDKFSVRYENDDSGVEYLENLRKASWKICRRTARIPPEVLAQEASSRGEGIAVEYDPDNPLPPQPSLATAPLSSETKSTKQLAKPPSYAVMILEAVAVLNEKNGSSLNAIRKFILSTYNIGHKQAASFNNLTLKAANRAVANNELEKVKHSFRLTVAERERRKEAERRALGIATAAFENRSNGLGLGSGGRRRSGAFTVDDFLSSATVSGHNKALRKELLDFRMKRDIFLRKRLSLIKPFLPDKDYFTRRDREEEDKRTFLEAKKVFGTSAITLSDVSLAELEEVPLMPTNIVDISATAPEEVPDRAQNELGNVANALVSLAPAVMPSPNQTSADPVSNGDASATSNGADNILDESTVLVTTLSEVEPVTVPPILTATLHDHQVLGISWMVHMFRNGMPMILGDQMGLGKTIQTIGFLSYLHSNLNHKGPYLIVVPLSVLSNWLTEIERFCPTFRAVRFHGPKSERDRIKSEEMNDLSEFDIVVTTFEILVSEVNYFRHKYVWTSIVIDEGHRLKNEKSQLSEKLRCLPCLSKVILTGTPLQNNLHELWAMLYYLAPDIFTSSEPFDQGFDLTRGVIDHDVLRRARKLLGVFMLRRLKEMVSIKLPSRKEVTLLVPLTEQQSDLYRQVLCGLDASTIEVVMNTRENTNGNSGGGSRNVSRANSNNALADIQNNEVSNGSTTVKGEQIEEIDCTVATGGTTMNDSEWRKLMNLLLQLRKICNHTYLLPHIAPDPYEVTEDIVKGSGKLLMLDRMLPMLRADGHRCLIFSQFTSMLDLLEDYCELREFPFVRLDGETNRVKRRLDVRRFNSPNSNIFIFLISTRAGGLGLNLATADTVILYDSDWNPQVDLQAMERAHRIGQTKPVRVFRLVCRGSVEERMVSRAEKKLFLNAMVAEMDPDQEVAEENDEDEEEDEDEQEEEEEQEQEEGGDVEKKRRKRKAGAGEPKKNLFQALGIANTAMSKSELASLIRFGANAVFDSEGNEAGNAQLSDEDLADLLERQGRDLPPPPRIEAPPVGTTEALVAPPSASSTVELTAAQQEDSFEKAQQILRDRMERLQEVDLRQLGSVVYTKKKVGRKASFLQSDSTALVGQKRQRKERIIKVDGRGTGYGGAVPILAENFSKPESAAPNGEEEEDKGKGRSRGRQWVHRSFCTLCGYHVKPEELSKCAHCPFVFHTSCAEKVGLIGKGSGMFICPHHRCGVCNRPTASAGGLLFRCAGCLTSYCEDCLPQEQIDSLGRCRPLEVYNYHSKQAYYIKCPSCCALEGCKPMGVLADPHAPQPVAPKENKDDNNAIDEEDGMDIESANNEDKEGVGGVTGGVDSVDDWTTLSTMTLRIHWQEIPRPVPKPKKVKTGKGRSKKKARRSSKASASTEPEEEEDDSEEEDSEAATSSRRKKKIHVSEDDLSPVDVPENCSLAQALSLILEHEALRWLCTVIEETPLDPNEDFVSVIGKVETGRYRSTAQFVADAKYAIEGRTVKRVLTLIKNCEDAAELKDKVNQCAALVLNFIKNGIEPKLTLSG